MCDDWWTKETIIAINSNWHEVCVTDWEEKSMVWPKHWIYKVPWSDQFYQIKVFSKQLLKLVEILCNIYETTLTDKTTFKVLQYYVLKGFKLGCCYFATQPCVQGQRRNQVCIFSLQYLGPTQINFKIYFNIHKYR